MPAQTTTLHAAAGSKVTIKGTSNVHDWECTSAKPTVTVSVPGGAPNEVGKAASTVDATIPVASLDCGNGKMTDNLRKAMHADQHPNVEFRMIDYTASAKGTAYDAVIRGNLTINGVCKPVQIKATVTPDGKGGAHAEGTTELRTPDYDVPIVKAMMGTIKTGERVTIVLSIALAP